MNFEHPLFLIPIGAGILLILMGTVMRKFPPRKINSLYGYRTSNSMKSQERWDFAQSYSAKAMIRSGGILMLISPFGTFNWVPPFAGMVLGLAVMISCFIMLTIRTERAIHREFGKG